MKNKAFMLKKLSAKYNIPISIVYETYNCLIEYEELPEVINEIKMLARTVNGRGHEWQQQTKEIKI
jgi:hypothetical protein